MTVPVDVEKFDFGGDCAMVTVLVWPFSTDVYVAWYVRFLARLMLLVSALSWDELICLDRSTDAPAGSARPR
jgi:hypothetical protein